MLRAYDEPVDTNTPLAAMTKEYEALATVAVAGDTAEVLGLKGVVARAAYRDFEAQLRARGITRVFWERHREDGSIKRILRVIA